MIVNTILFGTIEVPDTKEDVLLELQVCKERYCHKPSRALQNRIDYLEEALDNYREGKTNV